MKSLIKNPSAWLPPLMSLIVMIVFVGHIIIYGFVHETDEGTAAHIFQILMAAQMPIILFFAIKWLPRNPKQTIVILALQGCAALIPLASVFLSGL